MPRRYRIYLLSAKTILSYAKEEGGTVTIALNRDATRRCVVQGRQEQEENALFFQIQCALHGDGFTPTEEPGVVEDLSAVLCYVDFSGIFDRSPASPRVARLQTLAETMFRPEGVTLDLGDGPRQYAAFERSNSMSRMGRLSFIRADLWETVRRRIMLDLELGQCQLSKLYAYNGLMLSTGARVEGIEIDRPHRVIVVDNHALQRSARVITVEDVGGTDSVRRYQRVERVEDFSVTEFDGEGLVSKEYAARLNKTLGGRHTSFQIRLPFVKGMLHQVDFHDFFRSAGTTHLTDLWGVNHPVAKVDIILTKSMFKGYGWLAENGKSWEDYWAAFRKYRHALYVTNVSKERPQGFTQLNYQFLTTLSMTGEEFRPRDLPDGWEHSPKEDARQWLTKATETEYYKLRADAAYRRQVFTRQAGWWGADRKSRAYLLGKLLEKNPAFIGESVYQEQLEAMAQRLLKDYALGRLQVAGDVRFLSGDLLRFLVMLLDVVPEKITKSQRTFLSVALSTEFQGHAFYAPRPGYKGKSACTILRNPHIARNEEILLDPYRPVEQMRKHYLGHLTDVVMVSSSMYAAERLGGADFDGDMVKTIADPIVNRCVQKNYQYQNLDNLGNLPFLKIPAIQARVQDAKDWRARFQTVRDTFSSRVGQISNAALARSVIAYNENSQAEERQHAREEVETLAILTGLEIDSAKSGVKPDLSPYLGKSRKGKNLFLTYKYLVEGKAEKRKGAWSPAKQARDFLRSTDWEQVDANLERLPYLAWQLEEHTPKLREPSQPDEVLFTFAQDPQWKEKLPQAARKLVEEMVLEYQRCLSRIRASMAPVREQPHRTDVERILYARGQEELVTAEELYAAFSALEPEQVTALLEQIREQAWQFLPPGEREDFLREHLPADIVDAFGELLCDFRAGGYRILGDLLLDVERENRLQASRQLHRAGDSEQMEEMLESYENKTAQESYREAAARGCRQYLERHIQPKLAVQCAAALGKRGFLWDVLLDAVLATARKEERRD